MGWASMTDMGLDDEDIGDMATPIAVDTKPEYPYGLRISLTDKELKKLGLDAPTNVGDVIDIRAFASVTSISSNKNSDGSECCRVELQIEKMAVESEMEETG